MPKRALENTHQSTFNWGEQKQSKQPMHRPVVLLHLHPLVLMESSCTHNSLITHSTSPTLTHKPNSQRHIQHN